MYQEFRPDQRLGLLVECGWVRSASPARSLRVMPDGCVDLFVSSQGEVMIAGPATTFYDLRADTGCMFTGLRLRPGVAAAVLRQPVYELSDRLLPVDSVLGVASDLMTERVFVATTPVQRIAALQRMLTDHLATAEPVVDTAVMRAVTVLQRRPDWPVSALADAVGLSERQLRRRFESAVGYGPKRLARIVRFQRLLDLIRSRGARTRWAELAIEANYADQPHMINECRALAGMSPSALFQGAAGVSVSSNTSSGDAP
jgi:AraC-like DNA-binding protein